MGSARSGTRIVGPVDLKAVGKVPIGSFSHNKTCSNTPVHHCTWAACQHTRNVEALAATLAQRRQPENVACSTHNLVLRFVKAPTEWLPEGHKCADVCVACGIPGHPACNISEPQCMRRHSEKDLEQYRDGPTYVDEVCAAVLHAPTLHGKSSDDAARSACCQGAVKPCTLTEVLGLQETQICRALHCGSSTLEVDLPACDSNDAVAQQVLTFKDTSEEAPPGFGTALDADGDGCVEPYQVADGKCVPGDATGVTAPAIEKRVRFSCSVVHATLTGRCTRHTELAIGCCRISLLRSDVSTIGSSV